MKATFRSGLRYQNVPQQRSAPPGDRNTDSCPSSKRGSRQDKSFRSSQLLSVSKMFKFNYLRELRAQFSPAELLNANGPQMLHSLENSQ